MQKMFWLSVFVDHMFKVVHNKGYVFVDHMFEDADAGVGIGMKRGIQKFDKNILLISR